jgi:hypothetical protein
MPTAEQARASNSGRFGCRCARRTGRMSKRPRRARAARTAAGAFAQHAQQVAGAKLAGGVQLLDQPRSISSRSSSRSTVGLSATVGGRRMGRAQGGRRGPGIEGGRVELEAGGQAVAHRAADPAVELLGQIAGKVGMARQGRAQGDDLARACRPGGAGPRARSRRCRWRPGRSARPTRPWPGSPRPRRRRQLRAAGDLDLVLQRGLDQQADQVVILQDRAAGDDRPGDLDLVQRQDVDQGRRGPGGVGQLSARRRRMSRSASTTRVMKIESSRAWIRDESAPSAWPASHISTMPASRRSRSAGSRLRARERELAAWPGSTSLLESWKPDQGRTLRRQMKTCLNRNHER